MNKILEKIKEIINENMKQYLPHVKKEELENNGDIYYMNGKNGTEFDWFVNEHVSDFMTFYNDENNLGAVKCTLYNNGDIELYLYDENGEKLIKEISTHIDVEKNDMIKLVTLLKNEADDKRKWDASIENFNSDIIVEEEQIEAFKSNEEYFKEMINRKNLLNMTACITKKITEEGWKIGYMEKSEPVNETDSGWFFMAGNEDQEYVDDYKNIEVLPIGYIWQSLDPDIFEFLTSPIGSRYIRISSTEFEEDKNDKEIFTEKRED